MRLATLFLAALVLPMAACNKPAQEPAKPGEPTVAAAPAEHEEAAMSSHDPSSYAEPEKVVITHAALDLNVDFAKKVLAGSNTVDLDWKDPAATTLVLDTRDLDVSKVEGFDAGAWTPLKFELGAKDKILGSKLSITLPKQLAKVRINYASRPEASGLQWLTPAMTLESPTAPATLLPLTMLAPPVAGMTSAWAAQALAIRPAAMR